MKKMLAVVGPTASGKSGLAVELCKKFDGEVISCDSMQLYKKLNIGTAKPSEEEMQGIPHHLIDFLDVGAEYSVSDYVSDAEKCVNELYGRGVLPVFCGGTGLYIQSFVSGIQFSEFQNDPEVRARLETEYRNNGIESIYSRLLSVDPDIAETIDIHNVKRVIRALEVYETSGVTMTEWNRRSLANAKRRDCLIIGLDFESREALYDRINKRVDLMMEYGLLAEARTLLDEGLMHTKTASQAIAYKEFLPYFNGEDCLENCIETLKRNSRRYAKRQLTWFKRNNDIKWIYRDGMSNEDVFAFAVELSEKYLSEDV